jgi:alkanesulfonate monooxygenase SsuD/methylene tetrahydromethanopterin reductase-like flavin-dependent oxidoreductase (luciferase family)
MTRHSVGIQVGATTSPRDLGAIVAEAEELDFGEVWLAEDYFELGGIASAAIALAATEEIRIGLGVVAAAARHPAVTAMEFATLGDAYPGRFMAGVGHGAPGWVRQMGIEASSPLTSLREATGAIRQLMTGAELTHAGDYFRFDGVQLVHPPTCAIPVYLGVHGPASLRLSGELADGTLLGWFSSPSYVAWVRERIDEGRARAGRSDAHELIALCVSSVSNDDPQHARHQIGEWARPMLGAMRDAPQLKVSPMRGELAALPARARDASDEPLPARLLDEFVAAGSTADCVVMIDRLLAAGADRVVLVPNPGGLRSTSSMVEQMRAVAPLAGSGSEPADPPSP